MWQWDDFGDLNVILTMLRESKVPSLATVDQRIQKPTQILPIPTYKTVSVYLRLAVATMKFDVFAFCFFLQSCGRCISPTIDAETIRVEYDSSILSYKDMLEMVFGFHTPADPRWAGTQYRSAIFVHTNEQRKEAEQALQAIGGKLATYVAIEDASDFYKAEEYHQKYLEKAMASY